MVGKILVVCQMYLCKGFGWRLGEFVIAPVGEEKEQSGGRRRRRTRRRRKRRRRGERQFKGKQLPYLECGALFYEKANIVNTN